MRARWPAVVVLIAAAFGFVWLLAWEPSAPEADLPDEAPADGLVPNGEGAEPEPGTAPTEPTLEPEGAPTAQPSEPAPEVGIAEPAPEAMPMNERPEKPDLAEILALPEHLKDAPASEQRRHYEQLLAHQEAMLAHARTRLRQLEMTPGKEIEVEEARWGIEDAEAAIEAVREHLAAE